MRYLVLTDIHANLEALDACLADARARTFDQVLVLGDLIGYGADPNAVIDRVRELNPVALVRGNHDKVSSGLESADGFNAIARAAAHWTSTELTDDNRHWIARLPHGPVIVDADIEICHGSPVDEDEYIFGQVEARSAFSRRDAADLPVRPHPLPGGVRICRTAPSMARAARWAWRPSCSCCRA